MTGHQIDYERRFGGVDRLYSPEGARAIAGAHFVVTGVGGVGSWAVEALARTGARHLTLIDLDNIAESNTNRQIQALGDAYGMAKVEALKERIALINPRAEVECIEDFVDEENVAELVAPDGVVLDCIDQVRAKAALIALCRKRGQFVVTSGAAGGRVNPLAIETGDLGRISGDPLLSSVRYRLRKEYGFPKAPADAGKPGKPLAPAFRVPCVYSAEPVKKPMGDAACAVAPGAALACAGYGSGVVVTASIGMAVAALAINAVVEKAVKAAKAAGK
ncbi:tRNA threonylcarbamoyladenosine dehydratase [Sutterella sp.]|uniref:tRNA threonylcarbamoyladenosine dehydratase n=1 Tax=Sutterella sp. TaxID=1981025 RepID=UPI0026E0A93D|nr:tRNA threonylcarbamoyladenosine dehydratase [Sutterella sp.]MDO5530933.1 tRNA threonylcarbamoyladenosine dehydratase [Sutterella sp.]